MHRIFFFFQILDDNETDLSLKEEEKETSLMVKGKNDFILHRLALIMFELFSTGHIFHIVHIVQKEGNLEFFFRKSNLFPEVE